MTPSIIQGSVREVITPPDQGDKPTILLHTEGAGLIAVPVTLWLLSNLPPLTPGDKIIITALVDADHRIIDAMTILTEPPP